MKHVLIRLIIFVSLSSLPFSAFAWYSLGHMAIAQIAYQNLKPDVRDKVNALLVYFNKEYPDTSFLQMAAWPDKIRGQKIETFTHWHYIDNAFSPDGTPLKNLIDTDNAIWALGNMTVVLKNTHANLFERARFLAFYVHITGDLHQPLHTVSRITAGLPTGDRGGNNFLIQYKNEKSNLHRLWDSGAGDFDAEINEENAKKLAETITTHYPKNYFGELVTDLKPEDWMNEGVTLSKTVVYNTPENQSPSADYLSSSKQIAEQRVALAGYRLAALLNQLFGS